jgi:3-oxoacyl-ACP reductase-like protein
MGNEIRIPEMEVPQLRQMVLENTKRIIKNEQTIREMKEKLREEGLRQLQRETYWNTSREEHDRAHREHEQDMRKLREFMHDHAVQFEADLKKSREEFRKSREEFDADLKKSREEFDADLKKSREEFNQRQAELDAKAEERHRKFDEDLKKSRKEFNDRMKKLDENISKTATAFTGAVGHMVEGLIGSTVEEMFLEAGYDIVDKKRNIHKKIKFLNKEMEADVALFGPGLIIVIEAKSSCDRKDVDKFVDHMEHQFRDLFPEWNNLKILGAISAINYEHDADNYARQKGLFVIRTNTRNVFTLDPVPDKDTLRRF